MSQFKRVSVNIGADTLAELDAIAEKFCLTRSAALNMMLVKAIEQEKALVTIEKALGVLEDIKAAQNAEKGA